MVVLHFINIVRDRQTNISTELSLGHYKLFSCFLDKIEVGTGSVGRQKNKNKNNFKVMNSCQKCLPINISRPSVLLPHNFWPSDLICYMKHSSTCYMWPTRDVHARAYMHSSRARVLISFFFFFADGSNYSRRIQET